MKIELRGKYLSRPRYNRNLNATSNNANRASIYNKLDKIKDFRNRVNHCEPICFVGHNIDCAYALEVRNTIYNLIEWIDPSLIPFFKTIDSIQSKTTQIMNI